MIPPPQLELLQLDLESAYGLAAEGRWDEGYAVLYFGLVVHAAEPQESWAPEFLRLYQRAITGYTEKFQLKFSEDVRGMYCMLARLNLVDQPNGEVQEATERRSPD